MRITKIIVGGNERTYIPVLDSHGAYEFGLKPLSFLPVLPDGSTYPMYRVTGGNPEFAVLASNGKYGYYCPSTKLFTEESGMMGTVIERVEYVTADGSQEVRTNVHLASQDILEVKLYPDATGRNTCGAFTGSSANDNYSLYISSASSYTRYNGQLKRGLGVPLNTWSVVKMDENGSYINGVQKDTFTPSTFTSSSTFYMFNLPNSTSPKYSGRCEYARVSGKLNLIPVKVGTSYKLFDQLGWRFHEHIGTLDGGDVIDSPIEYPTEVYVP